MDFFSIGQLSEAQSLPHKKEDGQFRSSVWLLFLLLTRQLLSLPTQQERGQYRSRVWLDFYFYCLLDNHFHFQLNRREVSTGPVFDLSSISAAH
ncbi:hypothetical protein DPMN_037222 [Dreissena polymorpha]|uniref:Uncharacterized protein n=1 Tax=Dreissena polymorpha TaxID=45954 RepID=A0A9D4MCZ4_DREPO|nr:hypothetical protein DPMN_037222 [Dreissena polymorpha]